MAAVRFRVLDLNTPWFWLVVFGQNIHGKARVEILVYGPQRWKRWWLHVWKREDVPAEKGAAPTEASSR